MAAAAARLRQRPRHRCFGVGLLAFVLCAAPVARASRAAAKEGYQAVAGAGADVGRAFEAGLMPGLCDAAIVNKTCQDWGGAGPTEVVKVSVLQELLGLFPSKDDKLAARAIDLFGLKASPQGVSCKDLCRGAVAYISAKTNLPPASDVGCYFLRGMTKCDLDFRPEALAKTVDPTKDLPDYHDGGTEEEQARMRQWRDEFHGIADLNGSYTSDMDAEAAPPSMFLAAVRIAKNFRIYPPTGPQRHSKPESGLQSFSRGFKTFFNAKHDWEATAVRTAAKASAYLELVLRQFRLGSTKKQLQVWFGLAANSRRAVREVERVLHSSAYILQNARFARPSSKECGRKTVAYVFSNSGDCRVEVPESDNDHCTRNSQGEPIIYLCDSFFDRGMGARVEALVHESTHHAVGYTEDVCVTSYLDEDVAGDRFVEVLPSARTKTSRCLSVPYGRSDFERFRRWYSGTACGEVWLSDPTSAIVRLDPKEEETCDEHAYGRKNCLNLAFLSTLSALKNADNFCYFISHVVTDRVGALGDVFELGEDGDTTVLAGTSVMYIRKKPLTASDGKALVSYQDTGVLQMWHEELGSDMGSVRFDGVEHPVLVSLADLESTFANNHRNLLHHGLVQDLGLRVGQLVHVRGVACLDWSLGKVMQLEPLKVLQAREGAVPMVWEEVKVLDFAIGDRVRVRNELVEDWQAGVVAELSPTRVRRDGWKVAYVCSFVEPAYIAEPIPPGWDDVHPVKFSIGQTVIVRDGPTDDWKLGKVAEITSSASSNPRVAVDSFSQNFSWHFTEPLI